MPTPREQRKGLAVPTDVTQPDAVRAMVRATVDAPGGLDVVVNLLGGMSVRSCSRAGSWMRTRVPRQELAPHQLSVDELLPGAVVWSVSDQDAAQAPGADVRASEWVTTMPGVAPPGMLLATQPSKGPAAQSFSLMRRESSTDRQPRATQPTLDRDPEREQAR
jgi:NAD(P)-dependent dehydrogenase (short-subunit alcohol dehydrogenase family)